MKNGNREEHSYICGIFDDEVKALTEAFEHMEFRANKYCAEISGWQINGHRIYMRKLNCYSWKEFEKASPDLAIKIKTIRNYKDMGENQ